jgi:hypothetical protein
VDAQLPARLASRLVELGHEAVHGCSLPDGKRSTGNIRNDDLLSLFEGRLAVTGVGRTNVSVARAAPIGLRPRSRAFAFGLCGSVGSRVSSCSGSRSRGRRG